MHRMVRGVPCVINHVVLRDRSAEHVGILDRHQPVMSGIMQAMCPRIRSVLQKMYFRMT